MSGDHVPPWRGDFMRCIPWLILVAALISACAEPTTVISPTPPLTAVQRSPTIDKRPAATATPPTRSTTQLPPTAAPPTSAPLGGAPTAIPTSPPPAGETLGAAPLNVQDQ